MVTTQTCFTRHRQIHLLMLHASNKQIPSKTTLYEVSQPSTKHHIYMDCLHKTWCTEYVFWNIFTHLFPGNFLLISAVRIAKPINNSYFSSCFPEIYYYLQCSHPPPKITSVYIIDYTLNSCLSYILCNEKSCENSKDKNVINQYMVCFNVSQYMRNVNGTSNTTL